MAGHSQFKNIMHRKGAQDRKKAVLFAKISRDIRIAVVRGGSDMQTNSHLRMAIAAAKTHSMPKDNIERAIKRAEGVGEDAHVEMRYDAYGSEGVAFLIEVATNNKNRTASDVRSILKQGGGSLVETGSLSFMFQRKGQISFVKNKLKDAERIIETVIECGGDDFEEDEDLLYITCAPEVLGNLCDVLGVEEEALDSAGVEWRPNAYISVGPEAYASNMKLKEALEENADVVGVYTNME